MSINDAELTLQLAVQGMGIAMLPSFAASAGVFDHSLEPVLPDWWSGPTEIRAVFPSHRGVAQSVRAFIDMVMRDIPPLLS